MRAEIAGLQRELGVTTIYVTHDQVEAMTMGTRIAVLRAGVLQQEGPPQTLDDEPGNLFVAAFVGSPPMNLLRGRIERNGDTLDRLIGDQRLRIAASNGAAAALAAYAGSDVAVGLRPEHLGDPARGPAGRPRLRGRVKFFEFLGAERMVYVGLDATVAGDEAPDAGATSGSDRVLATALFDAHARVDPGDVVKVAVTAGRLHFFDLTTHRAIRDPRAAARPDSSEDVPVRSLRA